MSYVGDIETNQVLNFKVTTVSTTGVPTAFTGAPILAAYKDNSTTETILGITITTDFDSITGYHNVLVDTSQNTAFYASGSDISISVLAGTISAASIRGYELGSFSIENRSAMVSNVTERNAIADAVLDRNMATGTDSGSTTVRTVRQALRFLRNKWTLTSGTLSVKKEDDSTESWDATVGTTASGTPIISVDPTGP